VGNLHYGNSFRVPFSSGAFVRENILFGREFIHRPFWFRLVDELFKPPSELGSNVHWSDHLHNNFGRFNLLWFFVFILGAFVFGLF